MERAFSKNVLMERVPSHGNFVLGALGGLIAAVFCTVAWAGIAILTGWQVGVLALVVGVIVGTSIRALGRGSHAIFGVMGIVFTLASCVAGEMVVTLFSSMTTMFDFYGVLTHVNLLELSFNIVSHLSPTMAAIYAIGAVEGYLFSIEK